MNENLPEEFEHLSSKYLRILAAEVVLICKLFVLTIAVVSIVIENKIKSKYIIKHKPWRPGVIVDSKVYIPNQLQDQVEIDIIIVWQQRQMTCVFMLKNLIRYEWNK